MKDLALHTSMKDRPSPIKEVIDNVITELAGQKKETGAQVLEVWGRIVGRKFAAHTKVVAFKAGRLTVNVDGSSWLYELNLRKEKILKKLSKTLDKSRRGKQRHDIKELRLRIGEV